MWTVDVCLSGNAVGLTLEDWKKCSGEQQLELRQRARGELAGAGAHYLIDTLAGLPGIAQQITARLVRGERP